MVENDKCEVPDINRWSFLKSDKSPKLTSLKRYGSQRGLKIISYGQRNRKSKYK
jgi:hypothetical protein